MASVTYTATQSGTEAIGWAAGATVSWAAIPAIAGLQYTVDAPNELLFRSLSLNFSLGVAGTAGTLTVGLVNSLNEPVFSGTNLPSTQDTITVYSAAFTPDLVTNFVIPLELGIRTPQTRVGGMESALQVIHHSGFQGVIALTVSYTGTLCTTATTPTLVADQEPYLTGLPTLKPRQSRADFCPRCGTPVFREELVKDGYSKTLVCTDCWDPAEVRRRRFIPPEEVNP